MKKFYFTFGVSHPYRLQYVMILAPDLDTARTMMFAAHGNKWAFPYEEEEWRRGDMSQKYALHAVLDYENDNVDWGGYR